jgi:excinuclease ABC subunit C
VYWFLDQNKKILYVGKAKNLKNRLSNYTQLKQLSPRIKQLVNTATQLKFQVLQSEIEALLVEAELIRTHQPQFNILLKDDKSPLYVYITDEKYPQVKTIRKRDLLKIDIKHRGYFGIALGPFPSSYKLKQVLKLARKIFPWCQSPATEKDSPEKLKPCFYYHLDLCPGACINQISSQDYKQNIKNLVLFLRGKKHQVLDKLTQEMKELADAQKFEQAQIKKEQIENIIHITQAVKLKPDLSLPQLSSSSNEAILGLQKILDEYLQLPKNYPLTKIEGYDVSNTQGKQASVSLVSFTNGNPNKKDYRLFNIRTLDTPNDYQMMKEAITRRQKHPEWGKPSLIVIDGGRGQLRAAHSVWHWDCPVISLVKNPDRIVIPKLENEEIVGYHFVKLPPEHPTLHLLQHVRDESHRFSKKQHTQRRLKKMLALD